MIVLHILKTGKKMAAHVVAPHVYVYTGSIITASHL